MYVAAPKNHVEKKEGTTLVPFAISDYLGFLVEISSTIRIIFFSFIYHHLSSLGQILHQIFHLY